MSVFTIVITEKSYFLYLYYFPIDLTCLHSEDYNYRDLSRRCRPSETRGDITLPTRSFSFACRLQGDDHLSYDFEDGPELLQALGRGDGVDEDERVPPGDVEPLHGGKLVAARRVRDLERAHVLVAADHLRQQQKQTTPRKWTTSNVYPIGIDPCRSTAKLCS